VSTFTHSKLPYLHTWHLFNVPRHYTFIQQRWRTMPIFPDTIWDKVIEDKGVPAKRSRPLAAQRPHLSAFLGIFSRHMPQCKVPGSLWLLSRHVLSPNNYPGHVYRWVTRTCTSRGELFSLHKSFKRPVVQLPPSWSCNHASHGSVLLLQLAYGGVRLHTCKPSRELYGLCCQSDPDPCCS
jgi:hypothetical protein